VRGKKEKKERKERESGLKDSFEDLKYSFEANNAPCVFSRITAISSDRPQRVPQGNIGER